jgi:O-antigen ligase
MNVQEGGFKKSTGRSYLLESSTKDMMNRPLGVGSGNFVEYTDRSDLLKNRNLYYPHNLFFEIATEFGIITLLLFLVYLIQSIYLSFRINLLDKLKTGNMMFYTFVFLFLNSMISGDLNDARLLFVFIPLMLVKDIE